MTKLDPETLDYIFSNLQVQGYVLGPWGGKYEYVERHNVQKFHDDYRQFCADHHELTLDQFELWMETHGIPKCGETTKRGKRCKNPCGDAQSPAQQWLELDGGICAYHRKEQLLSRYRKR